MLPNFDLDTELVITIASEENGHMYLNVPFLNISQNTDIKTGSKDIYLDLALQKRGTFTEYRGIYLRSSVIISVYLTNYGVDTSDTYNVLPLEMLGVQYFPVSLSPIRGSVFLVIGVHNQTDVSINFVDGRKKSEQINRLEVYQEEAAYDLTGSVVSSTKPVAVISGNLCAVLEGGACDLTMTSNLPTVFLGKFFILPTAFNTELFMIRAINVSTKTSIFINQVEYQNNDNSYIEVADLSNPVYVTSSKPIVLVQYMQSDPYATTVPCVNNYRHRYFFSIPEIYSDYSHYLSLVVPEAAIRGLLIDGFDPPSALFTYQVQKPFNNYTVLVYNTTTGFHVVEQVDGVAFMVQAFGICSTGYGKYGYVVGADINSGNLQ